MPFRWEMRDALLGMNRRNLEYVLAKNPRERFPLADDKVRAKEILASAGRPVPRTLHVVTHRPDIRAASAALRSEQTLVVKPAQSYGGQGLLLLRREGPEAWSLPGGEGLSEGDLEFHMASILSGMYSLDRGGDRVLVEERLEDAQEFQALHGGSGVSDLRLVACDSRVAMAMLRLPCRASKGASNLHTGGIGVGIDLACGTTTHAIQYGRPVELHPDTGARLAGHRIPGWERVIELSRGINALFGLGYLGLDLVVDARRGPLFLEVNARPGLAIQLANRAGLRQALQDQTGSE